MSTLQRKTIAAIAVRLSLSVMRDLMFLDSHPDDKKSCNTNRMPFEVDRQTGSVPFSGGNLPPELGPDFHGFNGAEAATTRTFGVASRVFRFATDT
jgi:hypothetical protein